MRTLRMLQLLTAGVEERLWITDAYFLSMAILSQSLMSVARDGVDVRVLLPATNDLPWIGALSRTGYRQFLESGVRIFEYDGPMIHAKIVVADGWWSKVGSTNLNVQSLAANWEIDLVAEDTGFAEKMEKLFEEDPQRPRGPSRRDRRAPARTSRPIGTSDRDARRGVAGSGGHRSAGRQHGPPEDRLPAGDPRAGPGRSGQRRPARCLPSKPPLSTPPGPSPPPAPSTGDSGCFAPPARPSLIKNRNGRTPFAPPTPGA